MLAEGVEVTGVGPMVRTDEQEIDPASLSEIARRRSLEVGNRTGVAALADAGAAR
jgi:hypothetical protein